MKIGISVPIVPILGGAFVILKLCDVIAWSWWWVLAPFWIPLAIAAVVFAVAVVAASVGGNSWLK